MTTINLKDFYSWYTHDEYIEVSDEVAAELRADKLYEAAYQRRVIRNKAQYSLDCDDGIEYSACLSEPTPQELLERMERFCDLWNALNTLPETQGLRIDACIIEGKSMTEVAEADGVSVAAVHKSIQQGLKSMKKYLQNVACGNDWRDGLLSYCGPFHTFHSRIHRLYPYRYFYFHALARNIDHDGRKNSKRWCCCLCFDGGGR